MVRINIVSPGRFHVCDLARELYKNGWDVKFYSFVTTHRAKKFGLPVHCSRSVFLGVLPFLILIKLFPKIYLFKKYLILWQDWLTSYYMRKCDVLIAMSGNYVYTLKKAKKHGALIILERGSKHILEQKRILENIPSLIGTKPVPDINVKRELEGYQLADIISVASKHVKESFLLYNFPIEKLFVNPYGVDLKMFYPIPAIQKEFDIIMVGGWSYRKGCDIIPEAINKLGLRFLHVGGIVDLLFPNSPYMTHRDSVDQSKLILYYNKAKIFILPSREEGLAMVQAQAISCGLPIICSKNSGGEDLKKYLNKKDQVIVMSEISVNELMNCIKLGLDNINDISNIDSIKENLTWEAYGKRYSEFLKQITKQ
jgi:glycosyltransferase involved in cell wall biosynthesis